MTDTHFDSLPSTGDDAAEPTSATESTGAPARTEMTIAEVRQWLRNWVASATGQSPDAVHEATPMVELGLSSRDAVAMAADIEDHTGVTVSIAAAFEHPTIESLATWIVEGDPEIDAGGTEDADWTRTGPVERVDIAVVGLGTRLPGDMNTADQTWQALLEGRDAITDRPADRWWPS
jgi:polyketide synthase 13